MAVRTVELETVEYNLANMEHVAGQLLYNFAAHTDILSEEAWIGARLAIANTIREQSRNPVVVESSGLQVVFSGFTEPVPLIDNERVIYVARNPRFTFRDSAGHIPPHQRTYNHRATREIMEEMSIVYHLKTKDYPPTLLFPKAQYANRIEVTSAAQIV
jgi:hypothetical protein